MECSRAYQLSDCMQVGEEVSILQQVSDKTEWLSGGDTANQSDYMGIVTLGYLFHHVNLIQKISPLIWTG